MIELKSKALCSGCAACAAACPKGCIDMVKDKLGFSYPSVMMERCVDCGICEAVCPNLQNKPATSCATPELYAAVGKDEAIRAKSSSGGVFSVMAQYVISQGGVVFGAAFDEGFHGVAHVAAQSWEEVKKLQGSKYLQSNVDNSYTEARSYLEQGRMVLFTGTPCQISGLKSFLKIDYDNLYLQDIVCHGVAAPAVWSAYLDDLEDQFGGKTTNVSFRDKKTGWKHYGLSVEFDNGKVYSSVHSKDMYMRGFLRNYYLRPSCCHCKHKGIGRESDITLADFWGIEEVCPEFDDQKGTSLVMVSSAKGKLLLDRVFNELDCGKVELERVLPYNQSMVKSAKEHPRHREFEDDFHRIPIRKLLKKYVEISWVTKIKRTIKTILRVK